MSVMLRIPKICFLKARIKLVQTLLATAREDTDNGENSELKPAFAGTIYPFGR